MGIPWRLVRAVSTARTIRLVACLSARSWTAIDLAGRSRRQLRVQAASKRRPMNQGDSDSDTDYIKRALAKEEEDRWHDELLGLADCWPYDSG